MIADQSADQGIVRPSFLRAARSVQPGTLATTLDDPGGHAKKALPMVALSRAQEVGS